MLLSGEEGEGFRFGERMVKTAKGRKAPWLLVGRKTKLNRCFPLTLPTAPRMTFFLMFVFPRLRARAELFRDEHVGHDQTWRQQLPIR